MIGATSAKYVTSRSGESARLVTDNVNATQIESVARTLGSMKYIITERTHKKRNGHSLLVVKRDNEDIELARIFSSLVRRDDRRQRVLGSQTNRPQVPEKRRDQFPIAPEEAIHRRLANAGEPVRLRRFLGWPIVQS